jgi:hypothetical protein
MAHKKVPFLVLTVLLLALAMICVSLRRRPLLVPLNTPLPIRLCSKST